MHIITDWKVSFFQYTLHKPDSHVKDAANTPVYNGEAHLGVQAHKSHISLKLTVNCSLVVENYDSDHFKKKETLERIYNYPKTSLKFSKHSLNAKT